MKSIFNKKFAMSMLSVITLGFLVWCSKDGVIHDRYYNPNIAMINNADIFNQINFHKNIIERRLKIDAEKKYYLKLVNTSANAPNHLRIKTYDGYNQITHPDIVYIDKGFHGFKYWMAYTPYPFSMDRYENPCIAASNDGKHWDTPKGLKNPIVNQPSDVKDGGHYSDTDIISDNGGLAVYYVYNKRNVLGPSKFYRSVSMNGLSWSKPKLVYQCSDPISGYSPAVIKDGDIYKMWYVSEGNVMSYITSTDNSNWSSPLKCDISIPGWTIWHVDISKTDIGYEGLMCARDNKAGNTALFYIKSADGIRWSSSSLPVIYPSAKGWDSMDIYRSTFLKQNGTYMIWYAACGFNGKWNIGFTSGKDMHSLKG